MISSIFLRIMPRLREINQKAPKILKDIVKQEIIIETTKRISYKMKEHINNYPNWNHKYDKDPSDILNPNNNW